MVIEKRSKTHEVDHALRHELEFKAEARRNKLVGLWAAGKMGLQGDDAKAYAGEVIAADMEEPGVNDVVRKVMADFAAKGVDVSESELRSELSKQMRVARGQIEDENAA